MAKEWFKDVNFRAKSLKMIDIVNEIIVGYQKQGLRLTLRQTYYQCVVRNLFPNSERSYKNLGNLISEARLAGLMDWDALGKVIREALDRLVDKDLMATVIAQEEIDKKAIKEMARKYKESRR